MGESNNIIILTESYLRISYTLPKDPDTLLEIELSKADPKKFERALRKVEEELAEKRAQNIVYRNYEGLVKDD